MATDYNTGNATGSDDPRDLHDNIIDIDEWSTSKTKYTHPDRLGFPRKTFYGIEQDAITAIQNAGYVGTGVDGVVEDYAAGIEFTQYNQILRDPADGEFWRISGTVAMPYTTTGAGLPEGGAFVSVGDASLRQALADGTAEVSSSTGVEAIESALDRRLVTADSIAALISLPTTTLFDGQQISLKEYKPGYSAGGGVFYWDATRPKSEHNGGTVISPTVPFSEVPADYISGVGETDSSGNGCFIRSDSRLVSLADFGVSSSVYGKYPAIDSELDALDHSDILHHGNLTLAKTQYGIRRNSTILSARGGRRATPLEPAVTGVADSIGLAKYGGVDSVSVFVDNITAPYETWEVIDDASYTSDGFTSISLDFSNLKEGMILRTTHATPWYAFIIDWDASIDKVFVDDWVRANESLASVPTSGNGVRINPITKIWAHNANIIMENGGKTHNAVICEYGVQNKDPEYTSVNGIDTIMLDGSAYNGGAAYIARGGDFNWNYGYRADGSLIGGFYSAEAERSFVSVGSPKGYVFAPGSTAGDAVSVLASGSLTSEVVYNIKSDGRVGRSPDSIIGLSDGTTMSKYTRRGLYGGATNINVTLPVSPRSGDVYKIMAHGTGSVTLSHSSPIINPTIAGGSSVEVVFDGSAWIVL